MKNNIILFDLDGTLIDSTDAIYYSFCAAFKHFSKIPPTLDELKGHIGHTLEDIFSALGVEESRIQDYISVYKANYREVCEAKTTLLSGAKEAVQKASEFAYLGVVTTKTSEYSKILLKQLGVLESFSCIIGRDDVIKPKPDAEPILKALDEIFKSQNLSDFPKNKIFMIGDTPLDIKAANAARIQSIGVLCGYAPLEILQNHTQNIAKDTLEAVNKISNS